MLAFIALLLWRSLILIEQKGLTRIRLFALALAVAGLALTHYFSIGVIAAAALYVVFRFRGGQRKSILLALIASLLFVAVIWAPFAWKTRHQYIVGPNFGKMGVALITAVIDAPRKLLAGDLTDPIGKIVLAWTLAFLVYLSPAFRIRNDPKLLPAWLWMIGGLGFVVAIDCLGHTQFVDIPRYIFLSRRRFTSSWPRRGETASEDCCRRPCSWRRSFLESTDGRQGHRLLKTPPVSRR